MPERRRQADAYMAEARTTLQSARVLHERDSEEFAPQVVKNAYDALEQALSAGIATRGEDVPRRHGAKIQRYFDPIDAGELERTAFDWHSRRSDAQYVDFKGTELSVPAKNFDSEDARRILDDVEGVLDFVAGRMEGQG